MAGSSSIIKGLLEGPCVKRLFTPLVSILVISCEVWGDNLNQLLIFFCVCQVKEAHKTLANVALAWKHCMATTNYYFHYQYT